MADLTRLIGLFVSTASDRPVWQKYCIALLAPIVATLLTAYFFRYSITPYYPFFTLAVLVTSVFGGMRPGFFAVGLTALINLASTPPFTHLRIVHGEDSVRLIFFLVTGTCIAGFVGTTGELQRRLSIERTRLAVTLQSIGDAVIATDTGGTVTFMNRVAEEATGWTLQEATGIPLETVFNIVNETTRQKVENPVRKVLEEGRVVGLANHTILIRKDKSEIPIDDSAAPIRNKGFIVGVVLVFRDITESKIQQAALLHAEKLATVGKLASTIAHEINNPLEAVSNLLFLISQDTTLGNDTRRWVTMAESELTRVSDMAKQTLSFHRGDSQRANVYVADLVQSVFNLYRTRSEARGVALLNEIPPDALVTGVAGHLRQLVSNLVSNALDAMEDGGEFRASLQQLEVEGRSKVQLSFADTGPGIDHAHLGRIFQPFFTTKAHVGTGLGLWISRQIVEDHDGRISVFSRTGVGSGTTFVITLPDPRAKAASSGTPS